ncbi:hypothetical protein [Leucobacter sp. NPDC077196]|uniref:hypothetical protein n=1 Tax=Leucobacter sp. NPDC077196 TaxID=3154959 RepID=UPI00341E0E14
MTTHPPLTDTDINALARMGLPRTSLDLPKENTTMTNQKTPEQGGATEEQIEAAARVIYDEATALVPDAWEREEESEKTYWRGQAKRVLVAALSASSPANPADEHHHAEEREAKGEDHAATVTGEAGPSDARLAQARDVIDRTFGWKHLRKYGHMSEEWMDKLRDGLARNVLAFEEIPAATGTGEREKLITTPEQEAGLAFGTVVLFSDGVAAQLDTWSKGRVWRCTNSTYVIAFNETMLPAIVLHDPSRPDEQLRGEGR